jgi:hypothetical protein
VNHHLKRVFQEPAGTKPAWDFVAAESASRFEANVFRPGPRRKPTLSHGSVSLQIRKNLAGVVICGGRPPWPRALRLCAYVVSQHKGGHEGHPLQLKTK